MNLWFNRLITNSGRWVTYLQSVNQNIFNRLSLVVSTGDHFIKSSFIFPRSTSRWHQKFMYKFSNSYLQSTALALCNQKFRPMDLNWAKSVEKYTYMYPLESKLWQWHFSSLERTIFERIIYLYDSLFIKIILINHRKEM